MKLYFYYLDTFKNKFYIGESEAEEKNKAYKIIGERPIFIYADYIQKTCIGELSYYSLYGFTVVLLENDCKKAINIIKENIYTNIKNLEDSVDNLYKQISLLNDFLKEAE